MATFLTATHSIFLGSVTFVSFLGPLACCTCVVITDVKATGLAVIIVLILVDFTVARSILIALWVIIGSKPHLF